MAASQQFDLQYPPPPTEELVPLKHKGNRMREKQPHMWRRLFAILATFGLVSLVFATVEAAPAVAGGSDTTTVHVNPSSLSDHAGDCQSTGNTSGQLNVTDPTNANQDSIVVTTNQGTYTAADLTFTMQGNVLLIDVPLGSDEFITDATIDVNSAWTGQFVLSHYDCEAPPTTTEVTPVPPTATPPSCDQPNQTVTPTDQEGVVWNPSGSTVIAPGESVLYTASPADGYSFPDGVDTQWEFSNTFSVEYECTTVQVPPTPDVNDACGPNNATWVVPSDDDTFHWTLQDNGHLVVTIVADNTTFPDGSTTHDYGTAPDSNEACPLTDVTPAAYTVSPATCTANGSLSIPAQPEGVVVTVNGETVTTPFSTSTPGSYDVVYTAAEGFRLTSNPSGTAVVEAQLGADKCPVLNATGSASADCTAKVTYLLDNTGSNVAATYELDVSGKAPKQVTVAAGSKKTVVRYGTNGGTFTLWGPDDVKLDHGTIPRACAVRHPAGHINCRCTGTVVFYLNNTHSNRSVVFHESIGGRSWNVRVGAGQKLVNEHHGAPHARVRLGALGKTLDRGRIPAKCTPPSGPPPTGEKHTTGGKVVSGKA